MVLDVARTLIVWDRWSGRYGDYTAGQRIALASLHHRADDIALLRDVWEQPQERDPRARAQAVTQDLATRLARLAAALDAKGDDPEHVARFVMRCVFCCFAEDVGLLPPELFRRTLEAANSQGGDTLARALTSLWHTMDGGGLFGAQILKRFNGHFFRTVEALALDPADVQLLIDAAKADWSHVEPTIFGTLLVRALDPVERHKLGAEFTPREYIERLVRPTVEEPIRERWTAVQAEVIQLEETGKKRDHEAAVSRLLDFHAWMRGLMFLDPACGSGNFLYVTMAVVKRIELEVLREIERLAGGQGGLVLDEVHPRQFHGIEIKPWAREIAELTLWIGYHQFWRETHGGRSPPDPILEDTGTLECRDAVLAYDGLRYVPEKDRPDPTPRIVHPVTGELVPDPQAKIIYMEPINPRQAEWPKADFIIGNPPYVGEKRQREVFGDGYVDALRAAYRETDNASSDFVMYWWMRAARAVSSGSAMQAGLITTNSITQSKNRVHVTAARQSGARVIWAIADHPWVDESDGAAVRVAMTVIARPGPGAAHWIEVSDQAVVVREVVVQELNDDLSPGADVATAAKTPLHANEGLCWQEFKLVGDGFLVSEEEATDLLAQDSRHGDVVRPWRNGKDLTDRPRRLFAFDFGPQSEEEARRTPVLNDLVRTRVKPERDSNRDRARRKKWWRFGRSNENLRQAVAGLPRCIATVEVSKIRFFVFLDVAIAPDGALVLIGSENAFVLGVLSSACHVTWTLAAGGRMGVGNDPRYNKDRCFDAFPFPAAAAALRTSIAAVAERLDAHRTAALARDERVTMTGMYSVVEKCGRVPL